MKTIKESDLDNCRDEEPVVKLFPWSTPRVKVVRYWIFLDQSRVIQDLCFTGSRR